MNEGEPKPLRNGESFAKPWGGNVAEKPFPKTLHKLFLSRGFETQSGIARVLGFGQNVVSSWIRGESAPNPESFGELLEFLHPDEEDYDVLVDSYGQLLVEGFGICGTRKGSDRALSVGLKRRKEPQTEFDNWVSGYCDREHITLGDFFAPIGLATKNRYQYGLTSYGAILERAPQVHNLDKEDVGGLSEAVAVTIQKKLETGHVFKDTVNTRRVQKKLSCTTYNGAQAAKELGVSRSRVQQLRKKYGLSLLLIGNDLKMIKEKAKASSRTKIGESGNGSIVR